MSRYQQMTIDDMLTVDSHVCIPRIAEVAEVLVYGRNLSEVARWYRLSPPTVAYHVKKFLSTREQLIRENGGKPLELKKGFYCAEDEEYAYSQRVVEGGKER